MTQRNTMTGRRARAAAVARALCLAGALSLSCGAAPAFAAAPADSTGAAGPAAAQAPAGPREGFVSRSDVARLVFAASLVAIVGHRDQYFTDHAVTARSTFAGDLADVGKAFGNPAYSAPALAALWAWGHWGDRPGLSRAALRIAGGVASASVVTGGLKYAVGRWRPSEAPDDPSKFTHFSSHHLSFPSGHTTVAFSLASGIDHETRARWVPWVVYPLAGVTAWSRVRDRDHWASDVTAGAIVGLWASEKFRLVLDARRRDGRAASLELGAAVGATSRGPAPALTLRF